MRFESMVVQCLMVCCFGGALVNDASAADPARLRRVSDPSRGTTRLTALVGDREVATFEYVDAQAEFGCRAPLPLRRLAQVRDMLIGIEDGDDRPALRLVAAMLGSWSVAPLDQIPESQTVADVAKAGCTKTVKYRYSNCIGDCGTIDGKTVLCTCEVSGPIECPPGFPLPVVEPGGARRP